MTIIARFVRTKLTPIINLKTIKLKNQVTA